MTAGSGLAILGGPKAVSAPLEPVPWPMVGDEEERAVLDQLRSGVLSVYDRSGVIREFEDEFARYVGVRFAIAMNAGTSAIHSALVGCGIGAGDEVLVPTWTFFATATPVLHVGATPVFVDAEDDTGNMDPQDLAARVTKRSRAIIVVHYAGHPTEMNAIMEVARARGLSVIEDCSHAHGAMYRGQPVGSLGDVGCFSLQASKMVPAGEGGVLVTDSRAIYERATLLGHYKERSIEEVQSDHLKRYAVTGYGLKYRMHVLAAALAREGLRKLPARLEVRTRLLSLLTEGLRGIPGFQPPVTRPHVHRGAHYHYDVRYLPDQLDGWPITEAVRALRAEGVLVERPAIGPLHTLPLFTDPPAWLDAPKAVGRSGKEVHPVAQRIHATTLRLPTFSHPGEEVAVMEYVEAFRKVATGYRTLVEARPGTLTEGRR